MGDLFLAHSHARFAETHVRAWQDASAQPRIRARHGRARETRRVRKRLCVHHGTREALKAARPSQSAQDAPTLAMGQPVAPISVR
eukprot:6212395-Pleurochrysis_carterae.AAC.1